MAYKDPEALRAWRRAWRAANREKDNAASRARYAKNRDKRLVTARAWREANREKSNSRRREWSKTNPARSRAGWLLMSARQRATKKALEFSLSREWVEDRIQRGVCEATNIPFNMSPGSGKAFSPSLDRIDPSRGYTPDNVQVVIWAYNAMKGEWSDDVILLVAHARADFLARKVQQPSERPHEDPDRRRGDGQLPGPDDPCLDDPAGRR